MGQRVNIVLKVTDAENNSKVTVYHDQWGIGRKGLLNIIAIQHSLYNKRYGKQLCNAVKLYPEQSNVIEEYTLLYRDGKLEKFVRCEDGKEIATEKAGSLSDIANVSNPVELGKFIDARCDNNNGVVFVSVTEKKTDSFSSDYDFRIGFLIGHEDEYEVYAPDDEPTKVEVYNKDNEKFGKAYGRWLSVDEWCGIRINSHYADADFAGICKEFFGYFDIKEVND